jgi:hypothetical protein
MEITIKSFEKYGFKLVLESSIENGEPPEFTLNRPIERTDWYDALVWHKEEKKLTASSHNLGYNTAYFRCKRTFQTTVSTEKHLETVLRKYKLINNN